MSTPTPQLAMIVRRFTARYRAALLRKAALLVVLGGAALAVLGWRLTALPHAPRWSLGALGAIAALAAAGLAWWLRRRWVSGRSGAAYLDRTLGLQQRLVTAEEFARADPPPALYPMLMEDASSRASINGIHLPKSFDRTAAALAVLLLLVLLWPAGGVGGRSPLQQLASLPKSLRPPEPPPQTPPPDPTRDPNQQQQNSKSQQPSQGGGQDQPQPSGGGQDQAQPSPRDGSDQQSQSNASGQQGQEGSPKSQQQDGQDRQQAGQQSQGQAQGDGQQQQRDGQSKPGDKGSSDSAKQSNPSQQEGDQGQQQAGKQQQRQASGREGGAGEQPSGASKDMKQASGSPQGGQSGAMSPGDQEALKAEIQQLLKEVSGELKDLQQQLAAEQREAPPNIGTQTDPELFEAPMAVDPATGVPVPMNLRTDDATVKDPRAGGGTGAPGEEILSDAPQALPEDAQLSDTPSEEQAAGRQVVPPEYRNVFDRLNREASP